MTKHALHYLGLAALFFATSSLAQDIQPIAFTQLDRAVAALGPGVRSVTGRAMDVNTSYPNGQKRRGYLTILYDPASKAYVWTYADLSAKSLESGRRPHIENPNSFASWMPYLTPQKMILFWPVSAELAIWESSGHAADINEAERKSLQEARSELVRFQRLGMRVTPKVWIHLGKDLGRDFIWKPWDSVPSKQLKILSIAPAPANKIELVLECQWKERVILDSTYKVISHEKLP